MKYFLRVMVLSSIAIIPNCAGVFIVDKALMSSVYVAAR